MTQPRFFARLAFVALLFQACQVAAQAPLLRTYDCGAGGFGSAVSLTTGGYLISNVGAPAGYLLEVDSLGDTVQSLSPDPYVQPTDVRLVSAQPGLFWCVLAAKTPTQNVELILLNGVASPVARHTSLLGQGVLQMNAVAGNASGLLALLHDTTHLSVFNINGNLLFSRDLSAMAGFGHMHPTAIGFTAGGMPLVVGSVQTNLINQNPQLVALKLDLLGDTLATGMFPVANLPEPTSLALVGNGLSWVGALPDSINGGQLLSQHIIDTALTGLSSQVLQGNFQNLQASSFDALGNLTVAVVANGANGGFEIWHYGQAPNVQITSSQPFSFASSTSLSFKSLAYVGNTLVGIGHCAGPNGWAKGWLFAQKKYAQSVDEMDGQCGERCNKILVWPNPCLANDALHLDAKLAGTPFVLYAIDGREIFHGTVPPTGILATERLMPGNYVLQVNRQAIRLVCF